MYIYILVQCKLLDVFGYILCVLNYMMYIYKVEIYNLNFYFKDVCDWYVM